MSSQTVAITLGAATTKAVHIEHSDGGFRLLNYTLQPAPDRTKPWTRDVLAEHFAAIKTALDSRVRDATIVIGMDRAILRHVAMPKGNVADMRRLVRLNSKAYFQQDLTEFSFDCLPTPDRAPPPDEVKARKAQATVLVGGADRQFLEDLRDAARQTDWEVAQISLTPITVVNAASLAAPEIFQKETIALLDLGSSSSTITIVDRGELRLTRVVEIGGHHLTTSLAEIFSISYEVAEGIKLVMPDKAVSKLQSQLAMLGNQLREAIDFFEREEERIVSQALVSGGTARSKQLVEAVREHLRIPCVVWDPTSFLAIELPPGKMEQVRRDGPQLASAIGGAVSVLSDHALQLDLLAETKHEEPMARRDPVRRFAWAGGILVALFLLWAGWLALDLHRSDTALKKHEKEFAVLEKVGKEISANARQTAFLEKNISALVQRSENRFFGASVLDACQRIMVDGIQFMRLVINLDVSNTDPRQSTSKKSSSLEKATLTIQARNFADLRIREQFIESLTSLPYFEMNLKKENPVLLKSSLPRQVDPLDPSDRKSTRLNSSHVSESRMP